MHWLNSKCILDHGVNESRLVSKKDGKYQETIQSPDPGYHMRKLHKYNKHHKQEPRGDPFSAGDHKAAMNRRESMTNTRQK